MSLRAYAVTVGIEGGPTRDVRVVSPTDGQAGDAARPLMAQDESIVAITEVEDDAVPADAGPPTSQAAELAPVTPGEAAAPEPGAPLENDYG